MGLRSLLWMENLFSSWHLNFCPFILISTWNSCFVVFLFYPLSPLSLSSCLQNIPNSKDTTKPFLIQILFSQEKSHRFFMKAICLLILWPNKTLRLSVLSKRQWPTVIVLNQNLKNFVWFILFVASLYLFYDLKNTQNRQASVCIHPQLTPKHPLLFLKSKQKF